MAHLDTRSPSFESTVNPYVSRLASRLMKTASEAELRFDSNGWELITEVLSYAAAAEQRLMEQRARIDQLEHISLSDDLTGLANRRGLMKFLANALSAAARHRDHGVVGYIDLDGFKDINDRHGHNVGDKLLRHVAHQLKELIRPTDLVARLSGDEFAIVLTRCDVEEGVKRLESIQQRLNSYEIVIEEKRLCVPMSLGCAVFNGSTGMAEILDDADRAMYQNKRARKG